MTLPQPRSYWLASAAPPELAAVTELPQVDVAVLGGGIAGVTTAYLLRRAGRTVALVEARRLLGGVTGHTTAKVSAQHGLIYADLRRRFDRATAAAYATGQLAALAWIRSESARLGVDCELAERDSFLYTTDPAQRDLLHREADAAAEAGLAAQYRTEVDLPLPVTAAVGVAGQAQFHPVRWLRELAARIIGDGSYVAEGVRALDVEGEVVLTDHGPLRARDIVVATHFPILDRGFFFARMAPTRELVVAGPVAPEAAPQGMYLATDTRHSVRTSPLPDGQVLLIVLGEHFRPGTEPAALRRHEALAGWAGRTFGVREVRYRWSAQDNTTVDRLPYIGRYAPARRHLWVATGFGQWGMTNGTLAGLVLADLITGKENPWSGVFDPTRLAVRQSAAAFLRDNLTVAAHFAGDRVKALTAGDPHQLRPGEASVYTVHGRLAAIRRGEDGTLTALSARCTHLACTVAFNDDERSWDCPCHGSRFDLDGSVMQGPATRPLDKLDPPAQ